MQIVNPRFQIHPGLELHSLLRVADVDVQLVVPGGNYVELIAVFDFAAVIVLLAVKGHPYFVYAEPPPKIKPFSPASIPNVTVGIRPWWSRSAVKRSRLPLSNWTMKKPGDSLFRIEHANREETLLHTS